MSEDPSYYALDCFALGAGELSKPVEDCARCKAHLERIQPPNAIPPWVFESERRVSPRARSWGLATATALAAMALAVVLWRHPADDETIVKGAPSVQLYINRHDDVSQWDGIATVRSGDRIRLRIEPAEYRMVSVFVPVDPDRLRAIYREEVAEGSQLLPPAWEIDDAPAEETLWVVFSKRPIGDVATRRSIERGHESGALWRTVLPLRREGGGR